MFLGWLAAEIAFTGKCPKRIDAFIYEGAGMLCHMPLWRGTLLGRRRVRGELRALMRETINYGDEELACWQRLGKRPPASLWDIPAMRRRWRAQSERPADYTVFYEGHITEPLARPGEPRTGLELAHGLRGLRVLLLFPERPGFVASEACTLYYRAWVATDGGTHHRFAKGPHWRMLGSAKESRVIDDRDGCGLRMLECNAGAPVVEQKRALLSVGRWLPEFVLVEQSERGIPRKR